MICQQSVNQNLKMYTLRELVQKESASIQTLITHEGINACIRNQDPIIKKIFTYENLDKILNYMLQEQSATQFKEDQSEQKRYQKAVMIHFSVAEILCSECHHITNLLFSEPKPLIEKLLTFLDKKEHYVLSSYFSKAMIAITKRVSSPSNKFNNVLCMLLFDEQHNFLLKTVNHLYSQSIIECIIRWLSLNSYQVQRVQVQINSEGQQLQTTNQTEEPTQALYDHRGKKKQFLLKILNAINNHDLDHASVQTSVNLFANLVNQPMNQNQGNQNKIVSALNKKGKNSATAYELFSLVCDPQVIEKIFEVGDMQTLGIGKLKLIKTFVRKYKQAQTRTKEKYCFRMIFDVIQVQMLEGVLAWIQFWIKKYFDHRSVVYRNNTILLSSLQLLEELQSIELFRQNMVQYYTQNPQESVQIIIKTISTKNNLIQLVQSRIIMQLLNRLNCYEFGKRLLLQGIVKVIDQQTVREHVVKWAEDILSHFDHVKKEQQHIFENEDQQSQWQHVRQLVGTASEIKVGLYRLNPSNIYFCYSQQQARKTFVSFLSRKPTVVYNQKTKTQQKLESEGNLPDVTLNKVHSYPQRQLKAEEQGDNKKTKTKQLKDDNKATTSEIKNETNKGEIKNQANTSEIKNEVKTSEINNEINKGEINNHLNKGEVKNEVKQLATQQIQQQAEQDGFYVQFLRSGYLSYSLEQLLKDL